MKKITTCFILIVVLFTITIKAEAQTGVGTNNPAASSNMEVSATNKGMLLPRMNVPSITNRNPVASTPAEGLLIFNTNVPTKKTIFHWDPVLNSGNGAWNRHLLFKETPKTAVLGINGPNIPALDNTNPGVNPLSIGGPGNSFSIISSGHLPNLSVTGSEPVYFYIGPGTYMLEVSFLISAPAPDFGRGSALQNSYYNMGYYFHLYFYNNGAYTDDDIRSERAVLSKANEPHRVTFNYTFTTSGSGLISRVHGRLGRRSGSSHLDLVNIITAETYYKLTKLQ